MAIYGLCQITLSPYVHILKTQFKMSQTLMVVKHKIIFSFNPECAYSSYKLYIQQSYCELCIIIPSTTKGGRT